jgi:quercetin dioxygenase-like cupin family protein
VALWRAVEGCNATAVDPEGGDAVPEVRLLDTAGIEPELLARWDITGHQVNRHLVGKALTGADGVVLDQMTFAPGFVHRMHRHSNADMIIIPLSGVVQFRGASGPPDEVSPGRVLLIPRGNWHELSNARTVDSTILHLFVGVGSADDLGYEAFEGRDEATSSSLERPEGGRPCG